jgi:hypothetical protein
MQGFCLLFALDVEPLRFLGGIPHSVVQQRIALAVLCWFAALSRLNAVEKHTAGIKEV